MRRLLRWFREWEPAQLQAIWVSLSALLGATGVTLGTDVDAKIGYGVAFVVTVASEIQALLTRLGVYAPGSVKRAVRRTHTATIARRSG